MASDLFGSPLTKFGFQNLFCGFYIYQILGIFASYNCKLFQEKLMAQTQENGEKPHFGLDFDLLGSNFSSPKI